MKQNPGAIQQLVWFHSGPPRLAVVEQAHFLCLYLDGVLQSKMNQLTPAISVSAHLHPVLCSLQQHNPATVLQLGLGGGDINRFVTTALPATHLLTVENQPQVIELYQRYFSLQAKEQLLAMSAAQFWQQNQKHWDFVIWDIYPLFANWQLTVQQMLLYSDKVWINLSQPEYQQVLEALLAPGSYQLHRIEGYLNLLYEISSQVEMSQDHY